MKRNVFVKALSSERVLGVSRFNPVPCTVFFFTPCHFLSAPLFLLLLLFCQSAVFLVLSHPKSPVTAIYFTSDPLYDRSRFAFMPDGLPKRLSDKAMNTLSGFSLLVSLRSAGH